MNKDYSDMAKIIVTLQRCKIEKPKEYKFFLETCHYAIQGLMDTTQKIILGAEMYGEKLYNKFTPQDLINLLSIHQQSLKFFEELLLKELSPQAFNQKPDISQN